MKHFFIIILAVCFFSLDSLGIDVSNPRMKSPEDTVRIDRIINDLKKSSGFSFGDRVRQAALSFEGAGTDKYYTQDSLAFLRLNTEEFTPVMLVNTAVALAKASMAPGNPDWRTFADRFENIACAKGVDDGYPSLMYHSSEWIVDNLSRGNIKELTENYSGAVDETKSLDEMTRFRKNFSALSDSAVYEKVMMKELGFRTLRIPYLKKETIKRKEVVEDLRNGDIIILVSNREGVDRYDIGIISIEGDGPHLIHVSPRTGKVVKEEETLARYMSLVTKNFRGYRLLRPQQ